MNHSFARVLSCARMPICENWQPRDIFVMPRISRYSCALHVWKFIRYEYEFWLIESSDGYNFLYNAIISMNTKMINYSLITLITIWANFYFTMFLHILYIFLDNVHFHILLYTLIGHFKRKMQNQSKPMNHWFARVFWYSRLPIRENWQVGTFL